VNLAEAKHKLLRRAGILTGGILGLMSGLRVFGLVIGVVLGYFIDEWLHDRRVLKTGTLFLTQPTGGILDDAWTKIVTATALACAVTVAGSSERKGNTRTGTIGLAEKALLNGRLTSYLELSGRHAGVVKQLVETFFSLENTRPTAHAVFYREISSPKDREGLLELLFSAAPREGGRISMEQNDLIKEISIAIEMPAITFNRIRSSCVAANLDSYEILGIEPGANDQELRRVYYRLAAQFHPDTGADLDQHQLEQSREAFMTIKNAYARIVEDRNALRKDFQSGDTPNEN
jgi:hypothetical protein